MKNLNIYILFIVVIPAMLIIVGCFNKKVDYLNYFEFNGEVLEENKNRPIDSVSVYFIDQGFDEKREKYETPLKVCESNINGRIDCSYEYFWGRTEAWFKKKPTKKFTLKIEKEGYGIQFLSFDAEKVQTIGDKYQVDIGEVFMSKTTD